MPDYPIGISVTVVTANRNIGNPQDCDSGGTCFVKRFPTGRYEGSNITTAFAFHVFNLAQKASRKNQEQFERASVKDLEHWLDEKFKNRPAFFNGDHQDTYIVEILGRFEIDGKTVFRRAANQNVDDPNKDDLTMLWWLAE
jgi:hypothetical protein